MRNLKVVVRIRPLSQRESDSISVINVENDNTVAITNVKVPEQNAGDSRERIRRFTFDSVFQEDSTQIQVFEAIEDVIGTAIKNRYNSCVLAYGQSSSGKTHTMMGFPHDPGLTPKLCERLFDYLEETSVGSEVLDMKITASYLEIYNEKVRDLLFENLEKSSRKQLPLKIREHPQKGPYVQGLTEHPVASSKDILSCLDAGNHRRRVAATPSNPHSSRSHSVFSVSCGGVKLHLVDLAGSERADHGPYADPRFREGANINKSLVALGNVISALAEQACCIKQPTATKRHRRRFVPYRDSVLTWLLKDTLSGNSKTVMIATVSPSNLCYSETVNTLRFGQRAKLIRSQPTLQLETPNEKIIRELRAEISRLRELLKLQSQPNSLIGQPNKGQESMFLKSGSAVLPLIKSQENDSGLNTGLSETSSCSSLNLETDDNDTEPINPILEEPIANVEVSKNDEIKENETKEKLTPLIEIKSNTTDKKHKLRRTYSVVHSIMEKEKPKPFGSHENLRKSSISSLPPLNRRPSVSKVTSPKHSPKRKTSDVETKSKVDSIRKTPVRPRSQMISAVTSRLYNRVKKKEVSTDTNDINTYNLPHPKEISICGNARFKLKELTQKALRAHRNKHAETQTDLYPVLRVKEISTDVNDLKVVLNETKNEETCTEVKELEDKNVECNMVSTSTVNLTRSCSTQANEIPEKPEVSFAKYLTNISPATYEILSDSCPNNPIYTSSVNINISHNYINGRQADTISDDSLDETIQNLPTPDLISNHNSLEQNALSDVKFADIVTEIPILEECIVSEEYHNPDILQATLNITPNISEKVDKLNMVNVCAPQTCTINKPIEYCRPLFIERPRKARPNIIQTKDPVVECITIKEPLILKSIMRQVSQQDEVSSEESYYELPDSLEYHMVNSKKVHFGGEKKNYKDNDRMVKAMSSFLEEATILMNNLSSANKHTCTPLPEDFDVEVTVNNITGLNSSKTKYKPRRYSSDYTQTTPTTLSNSYTQYEDFSIPINKYEALLEDSCKRLEEKLNFPHERSASVSSFHEERLSQPFSFNPWDLSSSSNYIEDSSLESNPVTFSDYGSLPRRSLRRQRPSCSPSAYLRQLTSLRRQVIESSREELVNNSS
ncbi:unnamed protein product [Brassicogethes aeneus]|uniref:Kinesin motor domain-containing protein n=1 Tax=Brassicogethes aeneus TaxID=1431903 RepID=A0A9P0AYZ6_BRAAE|nr:unnamed protein product [Brassicogethes aeneus]